MTYAPSGEEFDISRLEPSIVTYVDTIETPNRGLYDRVVFGSNIERDFAGSADNDDEVVCFLKLPAFYQIPIVDILEEAPSHVARTVNSAMVVAYWLIGREIVEEEQKGQKRADYGKAVIEDLSKRLTGRYGKGYSTVSLWNMRKFYQTYIGRAAAILSPSGREFRQQKILSPVGRELGKSGNPHPPGGELTPRQRTTGVESATGFHPDLSWSHYRALMRVENEEARQFYEQEAARNHWNERQLERQINTLLFERLLKSRDKDGVLQLANEGQATEHPIDINKDPKAWKASSSALSRP